MWLGSIQEYLFAPPTPFILWLLFFPLAIYAFGRLPPIHSAYLTVFSGIPLLLYRAMGEGNWTPMRWLWHILIVLVAGYVVYLRVKYRPRSVKV
jgi:hypothetical protein